MANTLSEFEAAWKDDWRFHKESHESFCEKVNKDRQLKELRDYVEQNAYGMGERSFYHLHNLILKDLDAKTPKEQATLKLLEIGVHRGQQLALWATLADRLSRPVEIIGESLFDGTEVGENRDYREDVEALLKHATGERRNEAMKDKGLWYWMSHKWTLQLIKGDSTDDKVIETIAYGAPYEVVLVDGGHSREVAYSDVLNYGSMVKVGGYLVIDDCANNLAKTHELGGLKYPLWFGAFTGIQSVSDAVDSLLPPHTENEAWVHLGNVVHQRIWRKVK